MQWSVFLRFLHSLSLGRNDKVYQNNTLLRTFDNKYLHKMGCLSMQRNTVPQSISSIFSIKKAPPTRSISLHKYLPHRYGISTLHCRLLCGQRAVPSHTLNRLCKEYITAAPRCQIKTPLLLHYKKICFIIVCAAGAHIFKPYADLNTKKCCNELYAMSRSLRRRPRKGQGSLLGAGA